MTDDYQRCVFLVCILSAFTVLHPRSCPHPSSILNLCLSKKLADMYIPTYIHKEYLYSAKNQSLGTEISSHQCKQISLKSSFETVKRQVRSADGRPFQTRGPAAEKLLSPNRVDVRGVTQVLMCTVCTRVRFSASLTVTSQSAD